MLLSALAVTHVSSSTVIAPPVREGWVHAVTSKITTAPAGGTLARSLGLWAIIGLGLGYMTPTVVFDTFGLVARDTNNVVPAAYAVALIVMVFTAISYGKMVGAIPSAGSAYT